MKKLLLLSVISSLILSSCGTIVGGKSYGAYVIIDGNNSAKAYLNEQLVDEINPIEVRRSEADMVNIRVEQEGCPTERFDFNKRKFRWGAFVGSLFFPTFTVGPGIPVPLPNIIDFASGGAWKPDHKNPNIQKIDYDNFKYIVKYDCKSTKQSSSNSAQTKSKEEKLLELKEMFDKGLITKEEYEASRKKILAQ